MNLNGNGGPVSGIDLSQLKQPDPAAWVQQVLLEQAGVTLGGDAAVDTTTGPMRLSGIVVLVMFVPPMIHIFGVAGTNVDTGSKVTIPWHAIQGIHPRVGIGG
jgi:hypothetical protein